MVVVHSGVVLHQHPIGSSGRNSERGGDGRQGIVVVYEFI